MQGDNDTNRQTMDDEWRRERDDELPSECWDERIGALVRPPSKPVKARDQADAEVAAALAAIKSARQ